VDDEAFKHYILSRSSEIRRLIG